MAVKPIRLELVVAGCAVTVLLMCVVAAVAAARYDRVQAFIGVKGASDAAIDAATSHETDEERGCHCAK